MTPTPTTSTTEFQRFEALARRVLTTPKTELTKHAPKNPSKPRAKKRKWPTLVFQRGIKGSALSILLPI